LVNIFLKNTTFLVRRSSFSLQRCAQKLLLLLLNRHGRQAGRHCRLPGIQFGYEDEDEDGMVCRHW